MRRLIVTADDFGADESVNRAVEQAHGQGILTCASLMVAGDAVADAVARAKRLPGLGVGLHLVLVDGRPVLPPAEVPDLVDDAGRFRDNMALAGFRFFFSPPVRIQLAREIEAQFAAFAATGLPLDHVNAHKHFHLHPTIAGLVARIGRRFGARGARAPVEPIEALAAIEPVRRNLAGRIAAPWARATARRFRKAGFTVPDQVFGLAWSGAMTAERVRAIVEHLPPGLSELYLHPATADAWPGSAPGYRYRDELAALIDPGVKAAAGGVTLGRFADFEGEGGSMGRMERIEPASLPAPGRPVKLGSDEHLSLFCRTLLDTHDPYRPALIEWPKLEPDAQAKIASLPIWDMAVQTEGRTGLYVQTFAESVTQPLLREAVEMDAFEERRHKIVLHDMVTSYGIELEPEPPYVRPKDPEWAFMRSGYSECIDSFFGFGLFRIAKETGFFPDELVDTFEPVMREEGRHILFFVNWVAWWRRTMPWWRRPWFEAKVIAVWIALILERIDMAKGMGNNSKAQENNFTLNGSKELGVEISFAELARVCLAENDRRLAPYDDRLIRPRFVPAMIRLALKVMRSPA